FGADDVGSREIAVGDHCCEVGMILFGCTLDAADDRKATVTERHRVLYHLGAVAHDRMAPQAISCQFSMQPVEHQPHPVSRKWHNPILGLRRPQWVVEAKRRAWRRCMTMCTGSSSSCWLSDARRLV